MNVVREIAFVPARKTLVLLVFSAIVLSSACRKPSQPRSQVTIQLEGQPHAFHVGPETVSLKLTDPLGKPIPGAQVSLEGNMSHAGMAPVFSNATEVAAGSYRGVVEFSMAGDWVMTVHVRLADGQQFERQFEFKGVRSD
ncbi:MAG: hypothetical protein DMF69_24210 [Acidobacteria bacterium]|nr:MAG: hypothetical protein DMF69_24210 [Acidobacteriota bacterium]